MEPQTLTIRGWVPDQLANGAHGHWSQRQRKLHIAQMTVWAAAKQENWQPVVGRARLTITLVFGVDRRRDTDNLYSRVKGCVDGLVKGGWIEDDDSKTLDLRVQTRVERGTKATHFLLEQVA